MSQPESFTVEEVKARVLDKTIGIVTSAKKVDDGVDSYGKRRVKAVPVVVNVACESDMKPELILAGPKRLGEVNVYVGADGRKHYFDAATGAALGSRLGPKEQTRNFLKAVPPSKFDPAPTGTDRQYIR